MHISPVGGSEMRRYVLVLFLIGLAGCSGKFSSSTVTGENFSLLSNDAPEETPSPVVQPGPPLAPPPLIMPPISEPEPMPVPAPPVSPDPVLPPPTSPTPVPAPIPPISPMPAPAPAPSTYPKVGDVPLIPSNFNIYDNLYQTAVPPVGGANEPGAFRFICGPSHLSYNDPIVFPGKAGASHLHHFFGNTMADANSTYDSLRTTGQSTCGSPVNRSAYWVPAMMNGKGKVVNPEMISIYYKQLPVTHPDCFRGGQKGCVPLPRGLRYVFGYNGKTGKGFYGQGADHIGWWNCVPKDGKNIAPGTVSAHYPSIIAAAKNCPLGGGGNQLEVMISSPDCWDGINLDSADHRSHVAYRYNPNTDGFFVCPSTHPYVLPTFSIAVFYDVTSEMFADLNSDGTWKGTLNGWHLSSDEMNNSMPGSTAHADWFGAWDEDVRAMWQNNCIDKRLNCSGGNLGNGYAIKGASQPYPNVYYPNLSSFSAPVKLLDPPPAPVMSMSAMGH